MTCEELTRDLVRAGHMVSILHGDIDREDRDRVIDAFTQGKTRVLVTTNVLARGIDVMQVSLVINHDVPLHHKTGDADGKDDGDADTETYIHRIGRTARFGRSGLALNLIGSDAEMMMLDNIMCELGCEPQEISFSDIGELDTMLRECRRRDEENLRRMGLENAKRTELAENSQSIVPESRRSHRSHRSHKSKPAAGAAAGAAAAEPSAAPAAAAEPSAPAPMQ